MITIATLNKPYTEAQRMDFIVEYNHKQGYTIEEGENGLEALGYTEDELQAQERERINMLSLTAADVERAIYKAKDMDFEDIVEMVKESPDIDVKALKIELKANNFYRGNPWIEQVGALLGFTPGMLDEFFETGDYTKLVVVEGVNEVSRLDDKATPPDVKEPETKITEAEDDRVV